MFLADRANELPQAFSAQNGVFEVLGGDFKLFLDVFSENLKKKTLRFEAKKF